MAIPPSFNTGIPNQLMTEEEIRQYFVRNGGVVRNTDIVNYFRTYLSNPAIKDEARIIFKTYVNKLANVKVENGDKFLVLKRQYFPPIDGNGNTNTSGLPPISNYTPQQYSQSPYGQPAYSAAGSGYSASTPHHFDSNSPPHIPSHQMNSYPSGGGPPPYGYPPPVNNNNNLRRQNSQSQIYGSHFSLNSNYADPYSSHQCSNMPLQQSQYYQQMSLGLGHGHGGSTFSLASQYTTASSAGVPPYNQQQLSQSLHHQQQVPMLNTHLQHSVQPQLQRSLSQTQQSYSMHQPVSQMQQYLQQQQQSLPKSRFSGNAGQTEYELEYGLPPVPSNANVVSPQQGQLHRHLSPQNSGGSGSTSSLQRAPPPYRPPPPAANFGSPPLPSGPPPSKSANHYQQMRRSSLSSSSMSGASNVRFNRSPSVPGAPLSNFPSGSTQNVSSAHPVDAYSGPPVAFQYQRSVSVSGLPGAVQGLPVPDQNPDSRGYPSEFPVNALPAGAPPPPVPPRHKRGIERSPSAVTSVSNTSGTKGIPDSAGSANFGGSRHSNRRNMDVTSGNGLAVNSAGINGGMENDHEKENINLVNGTNGNFDESNGSGSDGPNDNMQNGDSETEQKISVRERMQKFNRIASESELASKMSNKSKKEIAAKHESVDYDTASLSSLEPRAKEWVLKSAQCDYHALNKLAQENPALVRRRDMNYTALHWASKRGHVELVKMLAGTYQCEVNAKSNGGYTSLHLAAQHSRQEVYDLLVKAYNADVNIRDHSGKKPMQYLVRQDTSVSMDTFKKIKDKRRSTELQRDRDSSFLRIGSLNVKVKSTREAFGYLLGKPASTSLMERMVHKSWGSADNLPEVDVNGDKDKHMMPPPTSLPHNASSKKKKSRRGNEGSPPIKENRSDSDSDTACGFGSDWNSP